MKKEINYKKINKYLNLLAKKKTNGYLIIGIFEREKNNLNTFGVITGKVSPRVITKGVEDFLIDAKLIKQTNINDRTFVVDSYKDEPTITTKNNP